MTFKDTGSGFIQLNDKLIHFTEYALFGYFLFKFFNVNRSKDVFRSSYLSIITGACYALSDEIHQGFVGYFDSGIFGGIRNPDFFDFAADLAGVTAAALIFMIIDKNSNLKTNLQE